MKNLFSLKLTSVVVYYLKKNKKIKIADFSHTIVSYVLFFRKKNELYNFKNTNGKHISI